MKSSPETFWKSSKQSHNYSMSTCCVCFEKFGLDLTKILICCQCKLRVHFDCYGDLKGGIQENYDIFLCERCEFIRKHGLKMTDIECVFCPNIFGLIRKFHYKGLVTKTWWCHLLCANLTKEVYIEDNPKQIKDPSSFELVILSSPQLYKKRQEKKCKICSSDKGFALDCDSSTIISSKSLKCQSYFHATCALNQRLIYYYKSIQSLFPSKTNDCQFHCKFHLIEKLFNKNHSTTSSKVSKTIQRNINKMVEYFIKQKSKQLVKENKQIKSKARTADRQSRSNSIQKTELRGQKCKRKQYNLRERNRSKSPNDSLNINKKKILTNQNLDLKNQQISNIPENEELFEERQIIQNIESKKSNGNMSRNKSKNSLQINKNKSRQSLFESNNNKYFNLPFTQNFVITLDTATNVSQDKMKQYILNKQNQKSMLLENKHKYQKRSQSSESCKNQNQQQLKLNDSFQQNQNSSYFKHPLVPLKPSSKLISQKQIFKFEVNVMYFTNETPKYNLFGKQYEANKMSRIAKVKNIPSIIIPSSIEFYLSNWLANV